MPRRPTARASSSRSRARSSARTTAWRCSSSTPTWARAQPFRTLCHNGEINALAGNVNRMRARAHLGTSEVGLGEEEIFHPIIHTSDSDSGQLDSMVELLVRGGRDIRHAIAMLIPEAWEG